MALGQVMPAEIERRLKNLERQVAALMKEKKERENTASVTETVEFKVEERTKKVPQKTGPTKRTLKRRAAKATKAT